MPNNIISLQCGLLHNNVYIVTDDNNCIIIDCPNDNGAVLQYINNAGYNLQAIVLTHGHFDHCGGVARILDSYDVDVYCHEADWQLCASASSNHWRVPCYDCHPTHALKEGVVNIGNFELNIMHTAGHTQGSVCIFYKDVIFTGDTLFKGSVGRTDFPGGDSQQLQHSLARLSRIEGQYAVCSGHGEMTTLDDERADNVYMVNI